MTKTHGRKYPFLILTVLLLAMIAGYALAQETAEPGRGAFQRGEPARTAQLAVTSPGPFVRTAESRAPASDSSTAFAGYSLDHPELFASPPQFVREAACGTQLQLLQNTRLDVIEFVDHGTAEPWVNLLDYIYFDTDNYTSKKYSLYMVDVDPQLVDPSPDLDMLAQGFFMPDNLTEVLIEYNILTFESNGTDKLYGAIFTLGQNGFVDETLFSWIISDSESKWTGRYIKITDKADLWAMGSKPLAFALFNSTNNALPGEWAFFDDITLTACIRTPKSVYLPSIRTAAKAAPLCVPPTEVPQDQFNANRGFTRTGATCKSRLSNIDRADYYSYTPSKNGSHTLYLKNLPSGTEWSAMIFTDTTTPAYAPGNTAGQCRIDTPGSGDKKVKCDLKSGKNYFIKVSAGSTPKAGSYEMRVGTP